MTHLNLCRPIDFIERWSLCHHLGFVVRYLVRATCQSPSLLHDLKKAQWYLARELECNPKSCFSSAGSHPLIQKTISPDWHLSPHLSEVLFHIQVSQKVHQFPTMREASLKQAMKHLAEEIKIHE